MEPPEIKSVEGRESVARGVQVKEAGSAVLVDREEKGGTRFVALR